MPDGIPPKSPQPGCSKADVSDTCALHVSGCIHGCSGSMAAKLASFAKCYEGGFREGTCTGSTTRDKGCVKSAGLPVDKYESCMGDVALQTQIMNDVVSRGSYAMSFPDVKINGADASMQAQDVKGFLSSLCKNGVDAAC